MALGGPKKSNPKFLAGVLTSTLIELATQGLPGFITSALGIFAHKTQALPSLGVTIIVSAGVALLTIWAVEVVKRLSRFRLVHIDEL